ncbi:ABC transporter ATP-binding protein [Pacificibacter maritimus]|nr:oligopeptide/dipeptide ABC transporter ATP-binding protein [Pacificibacter maritimus]
MPNPSTPLLRVRDLSVEFKMSNSKGWPWQKPDVVHAVNGVSFDIHAGKCLGVVGESGCGKSTLIRAVAGLVPMAAGQIEFDGKTVNTAKKSDVLNLRRSVQMIFQDPVASLNPRMTVFQIVEEPSRAFFPKRSAQEHRERVMSLLDRVGIPRRNANRYPHEFSGGQCQRVGIARALAAEPRVLLCDEPVSALDVSIQAQIVNLLRELQREMDLTLIFVAHDLGIVRHISDDVLVMYLGGMMEYGPAESVVKSPSHPYSQALLSAVPVADPRVEVVPQILDGDLPSPLDLPIGCLFETRCPKAQNICRIERPASRKIGDAQVFCSQL